MAGAEWVPRSIGFGEGAQRKGVAGVRDFTYPRILLRENWS